MVLIQNVSVPLILVYLVGSTFAEQSQGQPELEVVPPFYRDGQQVQLICSVTVAPSVTPRLSWIPPNPNQGSRLKMTNHSSTSGNRNTFVVVATISNVMEEDQGEYVCDMRDSSNNQRRINYTLKLTDEFGIKLNLRGHKTTEITVPPSKPLELIVDIYSFPPAEKFTWLYNGNTELKNNSNSVSFYSKEFESKLVIENPTLMSSGVYSLVVDNGHLDKSINITVKVKGVPEVRVQGGDSIGYFLVGQQHNVICDIQSASVDVVKWFLTPCNDWPDCDDSVSREVPTDQFSQLPGPNPLTTQSTLRIRSTQTAVLRCEACNSNEGCGSANYTFLATDLAGGGGDMLVEGPEEVLIGDNVSVKCAASKYTYNKLTWYNLETEDQISDPERVWRNETKYSYVLWLSFPGVTEADNGYYACDTSYRKPTEDQPTSHPYELTALHGEMPSITELVNTSYQVRAGDTLVLDCAVQGVPRPSVSWYKGTKELSQLTDLKWKQLENHTLTILVQPTDGGVYRCEAKNRLGVASVQYKVLLPEMEKGWIGENWLILLALFLVAVSIPTFLYMRKSQKYDKLKKYLQGSSGVVYNDSEQQPALQQTA